MASDNIEGQEIELLIRELSSPPRKPDAAKPTGGSAAPAGARAPITRPPLPSIALPALPRRSWVPTIELPSFQQISQDFAPQGAAAVWTCVGLGVLLCVAMPYWPYPKGCSGWLLLYLFAVAVVLVTGIWNARLTWEARLGIAHMVALGIVVWGVTLAAEEALPRIGYAKAAAVWVCP